MRCLECSLYRRLMLVAAAFDTHLFREIEGTW
jgi:hypothetical protein